MKKKLKIFLLSSILLFVFCHKVQSLTYGGCEYDKISRLKSFVSNINLSYDYSVENNDVSFSVTVTNLVPEIYFIDSKTGVKYDYWNSIDGELVINDYKNLSGNYSFYSSIPECYGVKLGSKYYNFPNYNYYYETPICQQNRSFSLCQKWVKVTHSYSELEKIINEYNNKKNNVEPEEEENIEYKETYVNVLVKLYVKYYYYILIGIIAVCTTIMFISKKKNSFDI